MSPASWSSLVGASVLCIQGREEVAPSPDPNRFGPTAEYFATGAMTRHAFLHDYDWQRFMGVGGGGGGGGGVAGQTVESSRGLLIVIFYCT